MARPRSAKRAKRKVVVAVSGGFDPVHVGHVRLFEAAKALGDELVVILNNDHWLKKKKGAVFMPQEERAEIIQALAAVDRVVVTAHEPDPADMSVCDALKVVRPHIFANGGDRKEGTIPEDGVCREMNCTMTFGVGRGGKVQSSSELLQKYLEEARNAARDNKREEYLKSWYSGKRIKEG
ncbi:MAG: adenylyltransferase/cytidyltransferase family protein [Candidatus Liptonbacteria bacterium]|nr:adenylyltransferase/cytidyltransferase family protein [Candidatus Liptonbacteria bacterium]